MKLYRAKSSFEPPEDRRAVCCTCACCGEPILEGDDMYDLRWMNIPARICAGCMDDAFCTAEKEVC